MKIKFSKVVLIIFSYLVFSQHCLANDTFHSASCNSPFPETMLHLQELIKSYGYTVSHVQSVDKGLKARGYESGLYRVVFFIKKDEMKLIRENYPVLIPYIPLSITIFEDGKQTGISAVSPSTIHKLFKLKQLDKIKPIFDTWSKDIASIFLAYKSCSL